MVTETRRPGKQKVFAGVQKISTVKKIQVYKQP